jgi:uncharacterized protein (DUF433 family)
MNWADYEGIWIDADRMSGAPCLKGTRVPPEAILDNIESAMEEDELTEEEATLLVHSYFPSVTVEQIRQLLAFTKDHQVEHAA